MRASACHYPPVDQGKGEAGLAGPASRLADFAMLTKAKLSSLVLLTAAAGYGSAVPPGGDFRWMLFLHTMLGTALTAFGAAVFNQLMEIDADRKMHRTSDRPLPAGRILPAEAFWLGWGLCGAGIVHLAVKVNASAAFLAELTLAIYLLVYTPLKRRFAWNTLAGGVSGALPPVIGWAGAGGSLNAGALWWFALLFCWQMPHFYAINWLHRDDYLRGGFVMLANEDDSGRRTSRAAFSYALLLPVLAILAPMLSLVHWWSSAGLLLAGGSLAWLGWRFLRKSDQAGARRLFLASLLYLPLALLLAWTGKIT